MDRSKGVDVIDFLRYIYFVSEDEKHLFSYETLLKAYEILKPEDSRVVIHTARQQGKTFYQELINTLKQQLDGDNYIDHPIVIKKLYLRNGAYHFIINAGRPKFALVKLRGKWAATDYRYILDKLKRKLVVKEQYYEIEKEIISRL